MTVFQATAVLGGSSSVFADGTPFPSMMGQAYFGAPYYQGWYTKRAPVINQRVTAPTQFQATAVLSGNASLVAAPFSNTKWQAIAILAGTSSVTASGTGGLGPTLPTMLGQRLLGVPYYQHWYAKRAPSINERVAVPVLVQAAAILAGSSSLSSSPTVLLKPTMMGQSLLATVPWRQYSRAGFTVSGSSNLQKTAVAVLAGGSSLITSASLKEVASAVLAGSSSLSVSATLKMAASAVLQGSGSLTDAVVQRMVTTAVLAGTSSIVANIFKAGSVPTFGVLAGAGSVIATPVLRAVTTSVLAGSSVLTANASLLMATSAVLVGTSSLTANAVTYSPASAILIGSSSLIVGSTPILAAGLFVGAGQSSLIAITKQNLAAFASMGAVSSLLASAIILQQNNATMTGGSAMIAFASIQHPTLGHPSQTDNMRGHGRSNMIGP